VIIFGRDDEISVIGAFFGAVRDVPGALVIAGEAGAGKTTLFEAGVTEAARASYKVLQARPTEAEANLSFGAVRDLLDADFDDLADELPPPQRRALAVALLRQDPGKTPDRAGAVEAGFRNCLTILSKSHPVLIALDDVQWLDLASRRVLDYVVRRLDRVPVALLVTHRSTVAGAATAAPIGLGAAFGEDRIATIDLAPLTLGAIHALLLDRLGRTFPRPVLRRIHHASRGSPFYALELGRLIGLGGGLEPGAQFPVPEDVRALARARTRALAAPARDALVLAAASSSPTVDLVETAGGGDLREAVEAGIVSIQDGRVRFTHPLFASSVYLDAGTTRRRAAHRRLAQLVTPIEERARHLALAVGGHDAEVAAELEHAAADAFGRAAVDAAVELIARACELTPPSNSDDLHRRRMVQAEYCLKAGDTGRAREIVDAALTIASSGTPRAEALFYRGRSQMFGADWRTARRFLSEALAEATASPSLGARIELAFAQLLTMSGGDPREAMQHARMAALLAERSDRDDVLCEALALQSKHDLLLGGDQTDVLMERAQALQPAVVSLWVTQWPIDYLAATREWRDDLLGAREAWEELCRLAEEHGDESSREWTLWRLANVECLSGAPSMAMGHLSEGYAMAVQAGRVENQALYLGTRALVEAHLGQVDASRDSAARALELAGGSGASLPSRLARHAIGFLELSLGNPAEAHDQLGPLTDEFRAGPIVEPGAARYIGDDIEALIELGRSDEAEGLVAWLEERAIRLDRKSALATTKRYKGLLLGLQTRHDEGISVLREALVMHDRVAMPFERARTLLALGRVARRAKSKRIGRASLEEALAIFDELGAAIWSARVRAELARIPGRRPSDDRLSPTEQRIASLLAEGRSTRDVAATLFMTPKTIETYATRIYGKLDIHSRAALARRLLDGERGAKV
jgi:DNA-binding NarL/FixJ family response regulator